MLEVFASEETTRPWLQEVRNLLDAAFDGDVTEEDWDHVLGGWHITWTEKREIVGHAAIVSRTLEVGEKALGTGYVEVVAVRPDRQGTGIGTRMMVAANDLIRAEFQLGALSTGAHGFYTRLGWQRWRGATYVRTQNGLVRTPEEDDGIMVLRFGPSQDLEITTSIACNKRPRDDW